MHVIRCCQEQEQETKAAPATTTRRGKRQREESDDGEGEPLSLLLLLPALSRPLLVVHVCVTLLPGRGPGPFPSCGSDCIVDSQC